MSTQRRFRRLSPDEYRTWQRLERQLTREGLGDINANVAQTGWTFARHSTAPQVISLEQVSPGTELPGLGDSDTVQAVNAVQDAAHALPDLCCHTKYLKEWAQVGYVTKAARNSRMPYRDAVSITEKFIDLFKLSNPWARKGTNREKRDPDNELCHEPGCSKQYHSPHGPARSVQFKQQTRQRPPKQSRAEYEQQHDRKLQELLKRG